MTRYQFGILIYLDVHSSIVREGIQAKLSLMPENARYKLKETLERIINEGSGGLIAIIL